MPVGFPLPLVMIESTYALMVAGIVLILAVPFFPGLWLVAHLDSKSQRYPLALRAAGASLTIAAWIAAMALSAAGVAGVAGWPQLWISGAVGAVGGALLSPRIPAPTLRRSFGGLTVFVAVYVGIRAALID